MEKAMRLNIKRFLLGTFAGLFLLAVFVSAQDPRIQQDIKDKIEKSRRDKAALETTANASAAAKVLAQKFSVAVKEEEIKQIIADVVQSGDKSVIPYLRARLAADYSEGRASIEVALFKLGEEEYLEKAIKETNSADSMVRYVAVWKLARFETKRAYRKLYELLDDESIPNQKVSPDSIIPTMSYMVKDELTRTFDKPLKGMDRFSTPAWKKWFEDHPHLLQ